MAAVTIKTDSGAVLDGKNPVLEAGQLCWADDVRTLKIGDGVTPWRDLENLLEGEQDAWAIGTRYYIPLPKVGYVRLCYKVRRDIAGKETYYVYAYERGEQGVRRIWGNLNPTQAKWSVKDYVHMWDELPGQQENGVVNLYFNVDIPSGDVDALRAQIT